MLDIRYFPVPPALQRYIERPLLIDFTGAVGFQWQFFPTGCYGVNVLVGPREHDFELDRPDDDGAITGVIGNATGTWCERSCLAFGVSLTPFAVAHLPLAEHDFDAQLWVQREVMVGKPAQARLRRLLRNQRSVEAKAQVFLQWIEQLLLDRPPASARATSIAEVAHRMREPLPPTMSEAARRVGLQRRQFEREFRRCLGTAPKRYSTIARVQQVPQLAWQGLPLAAIAAELGFADQAHMTHTVRDVTGMTPSQLLQRAATSPLARATRPCTGGRITHLERGPV